jgi:hypothetical protein
LLHGYKQALPILDVPKVEDRISINLFSINHFAVLGSADRLAVDVAGPGLTYTVRETCFDGLDDAFMLGVWREDD